MPGRPMKEYVALPASLVANPATAAEWVGRAAAYAASLPPKQKKARKKKQGRPRPIGVARPRAGVAVSRASWADRVSGWAPPP